MKALIDKAKNIQCSICDVDGVLTDGFLYLDNYGNELKAFHVQDGMGLKLLMSVGIEVAVITASNNQVIDHRMKQLGIKHYFKGQVEKKTAFETLKNTLNLPNEAFAYVGDDLPDLPIIQQVGLGIAVSNAVDAVKEFAAWETKASGGKGAVREISDFILSAKGKTDEAIKRYFVS